MNNNNIMTIFKIYEIKSYNGWTNKKIENDFEEYELNDLINILQNQNKGYHQRIDPIKSYQFFGDCDKFRGLFSDFSKILIDFLNKYYNIQIKENDISKSKACHDAKIDLCIIDTSKQTYVKPSTSQKYLDIITTIIKER